MQLAFYLLLVAFSFLSRLSLLTGVRSLLLSTDAFNLRISVFNTTDAAAAIASDCVHASPLCNFRSAWAACQQLAASGSATTCTIELPRNGSISMNTESYGSLVLSSNTNITVEGNNATVASSVGNSACLFNIFGDTSSTSVTTLSVLSLYGMTLRGFGDPSKVGGAVYIHGDCFVSLANVTIANSAGSNGGAIYMTNNSLGLAIDGCSFEHCSATNGGVSGSA